MICNNAKNTDYILCTILVTVRLSGIRSGDMQNAASIVIWTNKLWANNKRVIANETQMY